MNRSASVCNFILNQKCVLFFNYRIYVLSKYRFNKYLHLSKFMSTFKLKKIPLRFQSVPEVDAPGAGALDGAAAAAATLGGRRTNEAGVQVCRTSGPTQLIQLNEQQMVKLRSELDVVHDNMRVLSEMLAAHSSGLQDKSSDRAAQEDMELLTVGTSFDLNYFLIIWRRKYFI